MKKKFICTVCGYIHEGPEPPERCPICKAPAAKFNEVIEGEEQPFATVHELGAARKEGADEEMIYSPTDSPVFPRLRYRPHGPVHPPP